jgi:hypothetical protein
MNPRNANSVGQAYARVHLAARQGEGFMRIRNIGVAVAAVMFALALYTFAAVTTGPQPRDGAFVGRALCATYVQQGGPIPSWCPN